MNVRRRGCTVHRARVWLAVVAAASVLSVTQRCMAQDDSTFPLKLQWSEQSFGSRSFAYVKPVESYPLRAALEELAILGLGLAQYFANPSANSADWEFGYDWQSFRTRLSGTGYSLDTNKFDTNFLTHPGSGTLYYWAARSNRLPVVASFAYALVASTLWEFLGELRERVSINDMLVTPTAGMVLGETTFQLGAFFDRSCSGPVNSTLGTLLGPAKSLHDALDGAKPLRDAVCDRYGLSGRGAHEFRFAVAEAAVLRLQGASRDTAAETQLGLHTRIVALESYGTPGQGLTTFSDGNVTELWLAGAYGAGQWTDFTLGASTVPFGLHYRSFTGEDAGRGLFGHEVLFGLLIGTEYSLHRYDRRGSGELDGVFTLDVPGMSLSYRRHAGSVRWELELQASPTFAGIDAFALTAYLEHGTVDQLTSVARAQGYNYAAGVTFHPRARLLTRYLELGADLKAMRLWGINDFDRKPELQSKLADAEGRRKLTTWASFGKSSWPVRLTLSAAVLQRWGTLAAVSSSAAELQVATSVEAVF